MTNAATNLAQSPDQYISTIKWDYEKIGLKVFNEETSKLEIEEIEKQIDAFDKEISSISKSKFSNLSYTKIKVYYETYVEIKKQIDLCKTCFELNAVIDQTDEASLANVNEIFSYHSNLFEFEEKFRSWLKKHLKKNDTEKSFFSRYKRLTCVTNKKILQGLITKRHTSRDAQSLLLLFGDDTGFLGEITTAGTDSIYNAFIAEKYYHTFSFKENGTNYECVCDETARSSFLESSSRHIRKGSTKTLYKAYADCSQTFSTLYSMQLSQILILEDHYNIEDIIDVYTSKIGFSHETFKTIIEHNKKNYYKVHNFISDLAKKIKLDKVEQHDLLYSMMTQKNNRCLEQMTDIDIQNFVVNTFSPLGPEINNIVNSFFNNKQVHAYVKNENEVDEKRCTGAMCFETYEPGPLVYISSISTWVDLIDLCHEIAHAIEVELVRKILPFDQYKTSTILSETFAILGEFLSIDMLKEEKDRKTYIQKIIYKNVVSSFPTALFEYEVYKNTLDEKNYSSKEFNELFANITQEYFGENYSLCKYEDASWTRVEHLFVCEKFYTSSYGTATAIAWEIYKRSKILNDETLQKFLKILKEGTSTSSHMLENALKILKIDIEKAISNCYDQL